MPTPVSWSANSSANTGDADIPTARQSEITGLANGNYLVSWVEDGTSGVASASGQDIVGQLFDGAGDAIGNPFRLNRTVSAGDQDDFEVVATNDGGFLITYRSEASVGGLEIHVERFDASGKSVDSTSRDNVSAGFAGTTGNPQIATNLATGAVSVVSEVVFNFSDNLNLTNYNAFLTSQNSNSIEAGVLFDENKSAIAINTNGEVVVAHVEAGSSVELAVYNTSGVRQHAVTVETGLDDNADPRVVTLSNGFIAITWAEDFGGGDYDVRTRVYNSNLGTVSGEVTVAELNDAEDDPTIIALPQGGFVVAWENSGATNAGLYAQVFTNLGAKDGDVVRLAGGLISNAELGVTVDGRILYTYTQNNDIYHGIADPRGDVIGTFVQNGLSSVDSTIVIEPTNFVTGASTYARRAGGTINGSFTDERLVGQEGDDSIDGNGGVDTIFGNGGDDTLIGHGPSSIEGGRGDDVIVIRSDATASGSAPNVHGGDDFDRLDLSATSEAMSFDLQFSSQITVDATGSTGALTGFEHIIGTSGNDTFFGGAEHEVLDGSDGDDIFIAGFVGEIDAIDGGADRDTLDLSQRNTIGDEVLINLFLEVWQSRGQEESLRNIEVILGTQRDDEILGRSTADEFHGNDGDDYLDGGGGVDTLNGGDGDDTIRGGGSSDVMDGGDDIDTLLVDEYNGAYRINLGTGETNFVETAINFENVTTGNGQDTIIASAGVNVITTKGGNDRIETRQADGDIINAGNDNDTVVYDVAFTDQITVSLADGETREGDITRLGTLISVENLIVGGSARLIGDDQANRLEATGTGDTDNNVIEGRGGDDTLVGGGGKDSITGGEGEDQIDGGSGDDLLEGGADDDTVVGGDGNDRFIDGEGVFSADTYFGGQNTDTVVYTAAWSSLFTFDLTNERQNLSTGGIIDTLIGIENLHVNGAARIIGDGEDNELIATGTLSSHGNHIEGLAGNDTLSGGAGDDTLLGGDHDDVIDGGADNDSIEGGDGVDLIRGGAGSDTMDGGDGRDVLFLDDQSIDYALNLQTGATNVAGETAINFEDVVTGSGDDTVTGSSAGNYIETGLGDDRIIDNFNNGGDVYFGGDDNDTVVYTSFYSAFFEFNLASRVLRSLPSGLTIDEFLSIENLEINGEATLIGNSEANRLVATDATSGNLILGGGGNDTLDGGGGNDSISGGTGRDSIIGGDGDDSVRGGSGEDSMDGGGGVDTILLDTVSGDLWFDMDTGITNQGAESAQNFEIAIISGSSNDTIFGSSRENTIRSGAGDDEIIDESFGADHYDGGDDTDTVWFTERWGADAVLSLSNGTTRATASGPVIDTLEDIENLFADGSGRIVGNGKANHLIATGTFSTDNNTIEGNGGSDTIEGGGGADSLNGGNGADTILGGSGDDTIRGGSGEDSMDGGDGVDTLITDESDEDYQINLATGVTNRDALALNFENVTTGGGDDTISSVNGRNELRTNGGDDRIVFDVTLELGSGFVDGGADTDTVVFLLDFGTDMQVNLQTGDLRLIREDDLDFVFVDLIFIENVETAGKAQIIGSDQANRLIALDFGEDEANLIDGAGGDDTLDGADGDDTITGGTGEDELIGGTGADLMDGGLDADTLTGNQGADTLLGQDGDDRLDGGLDNDSVSGGAGSDTIFGGGGFDVLRGGSENDRVVGGDGGDLAFLGSGDDLFIDNAQGGVNGRDTVFGNGGNDTFGGGNGNDVFHGQDGADLMLGRLGNDKLYGGNQNDTLVGGDGHDTIAGGKGRDRAFLGDGNDVWLDDNQVAFGDDFVAGGSGSDTIRMGGGNDTVSGGIGADQFRFADQINEDKITDYEIGIDSLLIDATLWGGALTQGHLDSLVDTDVSDHLVLAFGGGHRLGFEGITETAGLLADITLI